MTSYPKIIDRILETIREHKTFCIVGHVRPDGDCVGSQLALAIALRNDGKHVSCWNEDAIPAKYDFSTRTVCLKNRSPERNSTVSSRPIAPVLTGWA